MAIITSITSILIYATLTVCAFSLGICISRAVRGVFIPCCQSGLVAAGFYFTVKAVFCTYLGTLSITVARILMLTILAYAFIKKLFS